MRGRHARRACATAVRGRCVAAARARRPLFGVQSGVSLGQALGEEAFAFHVPAPSTHARSRVADNSKAGSMGGRRSQTREPAGVPRTHVKQRQRRRRLHVAEPLGQRGLSPEAGAAGRQGGAAVATGGGGGGRSGVFAVAARPLVPRCAPPLQRAQLVCETQKPPVNNCAARPTPPPPTPAAVADAPAGRRARAERRPRPAPDLAGVQHGAAARPHRRRGALHFRPWGDLCGGVGCAAIRECAAGRDRGARGCALAACRPGRQAAHRSRSDAYRPVQAARVSVQVTGGLLKHVPEGCRARLY